METEGQPNTAGLASLGLTVDDVEKGKRDAVWDPLSIVNGDFEDVGTNWFTDIDPGWSHHGGGGKGFIDLDDAGVNHYLELGSSTATDLISDAIRTHNILYIPTTASSLSFDIWIDDESSEDKFEVKIGDDLIYQSDLSSTTSDFETWTLSLSADLLGTAQTLTFGIFDPVDTAAVDSVVRIDNVHFSNEAPNQTMPDGLKSVAGEAASPVGGLVFDTSYYAIVVDPYTIKLAKTRDDAKAVAPVFIDLDPSIADGTDHQFTAGGSLMETITGTLTDLLNFNLSPIIETIVDKIDLNLSPVAVSIASSSITVGDGTSIEAEKLILDAAAFTSAKIKAPKLSLGLAASVSIPNASVLVESGAELITASGGEIFIN